MTFKEIMELSPNNFVKLISYALEISGYDVKHIHQGEDIGIDILARKNSKSLAIQVKKYGRRKINLAMVYHTYGAAAYYDCDRAIIITPSELTPNAHKVARKLNVEIWCKDKILELTNASQISIKELINKTDNTVEDWFYDIWNTHVKSLQGKEIKHVSRNTYISITEVEDDGLSIINSNGRKRNFKIDIFRQMLTKLKDRGRLTREEINDDYQRRGSSAISAVLVTLPNVYRDNESKKTTLVWKEID